jgi:hypothetical protein
MSYFSDRDLDLRTLMADEISLISGGDGEDGDDPAYSAIALPPPEFLRDTTLDISAKISRTGPEGTVVLHLGTEDLNRLISAVQAGASEIFSMTPEQVNAACGGCLNSPY